MKKIITLNKQSGVTLITSLMMLIVMTVLGITAMKLSSVDLVVAKNHQHQLSVYQEAVTSLRRDVTFFNWFQWASSENDVQPSVRNSKGLVTNTQIVDLDQYYMCKGRLGSASSIGSNSPSCKLYMFSIDSHLEGTGAKDTHYQGVGKEVPKPSG